MRRFERKKTLKAKPFLSTKQALEKKGIPEKKLVIIASLVNLSMIIFALLVRSKLPPEIPLFYGMPEGEGQLASSLALTFPAAASFTLTAINLILISLIDNELLKKFLVAASFAITLFSTTTILKIAGLVGSF